MRARFVRMEWENRAETIASFFFEPASVYRYEAGQYAIISLPHDSPDHRGYERTMTLSSSPDEPLLKFTMRIMSNPGPQTSQLPNQVGSSFKRALTALRPGDVVTIFDAMGDLILPLDSSIPLVFVAGGIGIASFVGIMDWLLAHKDQRAVTLLYAVADPSDIVMQPTFDKYAAAYHLTKVLFIPSVKSVHGFRGSVLGRRLGAGDVLAHVKSDSLVYLSGPEKMVDTLRGDLETAGLSGQRLVWDFFDGYASL